MIRHNFQKQLFQYLITASILLWTNCAVSQEPAIFKPTGEFATIDIRNTINVLQRLKNGSPADKESAVREIETAPDTFAPPAFFALSNEFSARGDFDKALFWFYAGQLRANYDANRCSDQSARSGVVLLSSKLDKAVRQHQFTIANRLEEMVRSVLAWDEITPRNYDHRWISTYGMKAAWNARFEQALPPDYKLSLPESEWKSILARTRDEWLYGFLKVLPEIRKAAEQSVPK